MKNITSLLASLLVAFLVLAECAHASLPMQGATANREYIIIAGGPALMIWEKYKTPPHDIWWMNFIRASRIRIQQLLAEGVPASQITWFVYRDAYTTRSKQEGQDLFANINSVQEVYGVKLKYFSKTQQLIDHLNAGKPRASVKIHNFEYFGHSNKACWMFDYSNHIDSASKVWLHQNDFDKINRGIFAKDAFVKSWGCHSGEEMSGKFRAAFGIKMWGAMGRTQYNTHELPSLAAADGRWVQ
jgi:hypothetical protein